MKILLAHVCHSTGVDKWYQTIASAAGDGLEVGCFCVTLTPPGPSLGWGELDHRWQRKEKQLMEMYGRLQDIASTYDALLLYNGANIHPDFLQYLPTFNVYCCFDDPESSANLSAPVAHAFDAVFYGNIASRFKYESWGCEHLAWLPIFTSPGDVPHFANGEKLLEAERDFPVSFVGEKNVYRSRRLEVLSKAFPSSQCFGKGWPGGVIDDSQKKEIFQSSRIGWNLHNSTGPINRRLFTLPAYGVMQICDNKTGLGQIFRLGEEVVGFDTIPEAIELTQYFLEHEDERRRIAVNGFQRYWQDYHPAAIWQRIVKQINEWREIDNAPKVKLPLPQNQIIQTLKFCGREFLLSTKSFVNHASLISRGTMRRGNTFSPINDLRFDERVYLGEEVSPYIENPEMKGVNMAKERLANREPFEWPNMVALNWAVTSLIRNAKRIIEIGSGTGPFAELASVVPERELLCIEEDDFARSWAAQNRAHPNVSYSKFYDMNLVEEFDLLVSLDVFEHVGDMREFLTFCSRRAPRAIFSTPNRVVVRGTLDMGPPVYSPHVREFSPGEIYWILKQYYREVFLYYMPDVYVPRLLPMNILTKGTPIIADCRKPILGAVEH